MPAPTAAALDRTLRLLDSKPFILGPWSHPALTQLQSEGLASSENLTGVDGRVSGSRLWRITPQGRARGGRAHA